MELIDTPNPNAKKIISELSESAVSEDLYKIEGVSSVFFGVVGVCYLLFLALITLKNLKG